MSKATRPLFLLGLCAIASACLALPDDAEKDLELEAESLVYDELKNTLTYSGSVTMQQGSMLIKADDVIIFGNAEKATRVLATGRPAHFQQTPSVGAEPVTARAIKLDYDIHNKGLILEGDATLDQEGASLSGNRIEYDVKQALVKASSLSEGSDEKKRVKMIIPPKALQQEQDAAEQQPEENSAQ
ncbi:lipopolysaccharide transport periplasmic protein LptA [Agaribacterium sp. ZY112]|uniref:lipopolysaccharide transport periplasmic protein LptA n=1 Tax=Agaribacterium sp. ZY112 TaxID=3233574 RepID=UPI0035267DA5